MREPSRAIRAMPRSGIREIFDLANTIPGAIHLEMGEPDFPTPEHIRTAAAEAAERGFTRYTPNAGLPELRAAIAEKARSRNGLDAIAEQVVVTPGGIAALFGSALALCDPGDEVLVSDPAWPNYRMIADLQGLRVRHYRLRPEDGMQPDPEDLERLVTERTKLLIVNSPSNPTGAVIEDDVMGSLLEVAAAHDLWVVSDEVYDEMTFDGPGTAVAALGFPERVVSVFSFSKTYAMTGWRIGYAIVPREIAPSVVKTQEPITACVNAPTQMAALAALQGPQDCVQEMRESYRTRRDRVLEILDQASVPVVPPSGAFYVWIDVSGSGLDGSQFARRLLVEREVAVTPGVAFGPGSGSHVRVSLASSPEFLYEGVTRLVDSLTGSA